MAQLLRLRGLDLLPAISIEKNSWGALIFSPLNFHAQLLNLIEGGYRVIGQRWSAILGDDNGVMLLGVPGAVEMPSQPRAADGEPSAVNLIDVTAGQSSASSLQAPCHAVFMIDPGRRARTRGRDLAQPSILPTLRHAWPIFRLPAHRRLDRLPLKLASQCHCLSVQLSKDAGEFFSLIEAIRRRPLRAPASIATSTPSLQLYLPKRKNKPPSATTLRAG